MFSRLLGLFIASFLLLVTLAVPSFAQTPNTLTPIPSTVSPTSPLFTDMLAYNIFHTFSCLAIGGSVIGQPCLTYQHGIPMLSQVDTSGGVLGTTTSLIGALYANPPVRTADYLASVGQDLGFVKEANAQVVGSGADVLSPILALWKVSRNISYVIMIVIFVIIGLMVMFRQRINPQTVITAQAALPGLVIGLLLITFSYFLAGLISDMAFVGTNMVGYYFAAAQGKTDDPQRVNLAQNISSDSVLTIFSKFTDAIDQGQIAHAVEIVFNSTGENVQGFLRGFVAILAFQFGSPIGHIVPIIGDIASIITGTATAAISGLAIAQVLGLAMNGIVIAIIIYTMLKLLLRLINSFLTIIFLTVTAPFQFLIASLPGRQGIATGWILNMLANILVFPAILAVFYFVAFLLKKSFGPLIISNSSILQGGVVPVAYAQASTSITGSSTFPLFGGMNLEFINFLLAFGALIALPAIPDLIVRTVGRAGQAGQLIGQEISGGIRSGRGYADQFRQQGLGAVTYAGHQYEHFRGQVQDYSPATSAGLANKQFPTWIPIIGGRRPFGKKTNT